MENVILALFYILFPAAVLYACEKNSALNAIGAAVLCYGVGILISLTGIIPPQAKGVQDTLMNVTVPLAIPLMLFSTDLKRWSRLAGKTLLSFAIILVSVFISAFIAFILLQNHVDESWKVSGMLIGMYTGGTPNMTAIGLALKVKEHILVLANTADMIFSIPWFIFTLTIAQRVLNKFLPPFEQTLTRGTSNEIAVTDEIDHERTGFSRYTGIFRREKIIPLSGAFAVALGIFAIGAGLFLTIPKEFNMAALILAITTLGIGCSFIPAIRNIDMSFQLGMYIILIFCLVVGSMADLRLLLSAAPVIVLYTIIVMYGAWILHILFSRIFKIDTDTMIITSVAAIYSPPFVPVAAAGLKNKEIVISGLATGIMGYVVGNYLGIAFSYFLKAIF